MISIKTLRKLLWLDLWTGKLYWKPRTPKQFEDGKFSAERRCKSWNALYGNKEAFTGQHGNGYLNSNYRGQNYFAHRVVLAMVNGRWPPAEVDHINGICDDNRPCNLREATRAMNSRNRAIRGTSKSGVPGVSWHKASGKWQARIGRHGYIGIFIRFEDAVAARKTVEKEHGYHQNHGREMHTSPK